MMPGVRNSTSRYSRNPLAGLELFSTCQPVAGERTSKALLGAVDRPQALPPVASLGFSLGTTIQP